MKKGGLTRWFSERWVNLGAPKKGGGYEECGRSDASKGAYPKCVPAAKAQAMTKAEIRSALQRKRSAEKSTKRIGKKPIMVATEQPKGD